MSIRVTCPNCQTVSVCPDEYRGRLLRCKKCSQPFQAGNPGPAKSTPATTPKPAAKTSRPATVPAPAKEPPRRRRLGAILLVGLALLLGAAVGFPVAYLLTRDRSPRVEASVLPTAPSDAGSPQTPRELPPAATGRPDKPTDTRPGDTGTRPAPVETPVTWKPYPSDEGRFTVNFPSEPTRTRKNDGGVHLTYSAEIRQRNSTFTVVCTDLNPQAVVEPSAILNSVAERFQKTTRARREITLGKYPGLELTLEEEQASGVWLTVHRIFLVGERMYDVIAACPRDKKIDSEFGLFFASFSVTDPPKPVDVVKPEKPADPIKPDKPPVVAIRDLSVLVLTLPTGWKARQNRFLKSWDVWKGADATPPERDVVRIELCPTDAQTAAVNAALAKAKGEPDFDGGWREVGEKQALPDGFYIFGTVRATAEPKAGPLLGLVAVREVDGLKLRCRSSNLRDETSRAEALELFRGAKLGGRK
jgi:hypothetical protein